MDSTSILSVSSKTQKESTINAIDITDIRKNNIDCHTYLNGVNNINYDIIPDIIDINEFYENVTYIAGYVITMLKKALLCKVCIDLLICEEPDGINYLLIKRRNLGKSNFMYSVTCLMICT